MMPFRSRLTGLAVSACLGAVVIVIPTTSRAQTPDTQIYPPYYGVEVTNTVTANEYEMIGITTASNLDPYDIEYVGSEAVLASGSYPGTSQIALGAVDYEYNFAGAGYPVTASTVVGQPYELQGWFGACYYYGGTGDDDDDDDDDGGGPAIARAQNVASPQLISPPYPCEPVTWGYWWLDFNTGVPTVHSLTPNSGTIGDTSKSISVSGTNFTGDFGNATVSMSGGITSSANVTSSTSATVTYSIPTGESASAHNLTMSNSFGISNLAPFNVGYPGANVAGLVPPIWTAGTTFPLTITGTGFGTAPTLTIVGWGVTHTVPTVNPGGTQMQTTVSVDAAAPDGGATVTVQPGYTGASYQCATCNGASPNGTDVAPVMAITPPTPVIILGTDATQCGTASNVANTTQTISVGQRVAFVGCLPSLPTGLQVTSESWSPTLPNKVATIGNFTVTSSTSAPPYQETITPVSSTSCTAGSPCAYNSFYLVTPGTTQTFTFSYTLNNGKSGIVAFTLVSQGPQGVTINVTPGPGAQFQQYQVTRTGKYVIGLGNANSNSTSGIFFTASAPPSSTAPGSYSWVQIVTNDDEKVISVAGSTDLPSDPDEIPGLDTSYPYLSGQQQTGDAPYVTLVARLGEISQTFGATMFLMWTPAADPSCNAGSACTVPVPLASVPWSFRDDTINTLNPNASGAYQDWLLGPCLTPPGSPNVDLLSQSSDYPTWTQVAQ